MARPATAWSAPGGIPERSEELMAHHLPQAPAHYRLVQPDDLTAGLRPYRRLAWLWVYFQDSRTGREWSMTGTGVFIYDDVILTCAHIFALNATIDQVVHVSAVPAHNAALTEHSEPPAGLFADTVFPCAGAFPRNRRPDEFDPEWDLALVCLSAPVDPRHSPPFVLEAYPHLRDDPQFQGAHSTLRTIGYGAAAEGLMAETNLPVLDAFHQRNWLEVNRRVSPGQSGSPIFYENRDEFQRAEFRLVGVVSCDDRNAPQQTIGTMITDRTEAWINRALGAWVQRKRARLTGVRLVD